MKRSRYSPISASMICSSRAVPSVATTSACVSPRVNSAEPCVRGSTPVRMRIGTHGARIAAVDARLAGQDLVADDLRFEVEQHVAGVAAHVGRRIGIDAFGVDLRRDFLDPLRARLLRANAIRFAQVRFGDGRDRAISASSFAGGCQSHSGLPPSSTSSWISSITACCCWWPNTTAPSITSSGSSCASDSTISTAASVPATTRFSCDVSSSVFGRIQHVLAVDVADARGADRTVERNARQRDRRRRADHRRNVGIDLGVDRHHRRDDLHFVVEAIGKQRPDRTVDQARRQRFLFRRPAFTLEEAAGDLARGVGLFLVVDGQREEVLAGLRLASPRRRDQHDGVAEADEHGAAGLARDFAGFERQRVAAVGESIS